MGAGTFGVNNSGKLNYHLTWPRYFAPIGARRCENGPLKGRFEEIAEIRRQAQPSQKK
jgi:hypothetical protein